MTKSKALLVASLASAMSVSAFAGEMGKGEMKKEGAGDKVHCYGVNKCKGTGDCGGEAGGSCRGTNACKHTGFLDMDKDTCMKVDGGRLTAKADMKDMKGEKSMEKMEKGAEGKK